MPLVGKFSADFASFYDAVQKAEVSLRSFEQGGEKVSAALTRMGNSFSGQKIISDATLMEKAIRDAGGASTLTANEMARVNTTVNEAIAKYKALGGQAPQAMQDLAKATQGAGGATSSFAAGLGQLNGVLGALGVGLSIGAVVNFGRELLRMGDEIVRVADRTGLTIDEVQRLSFVASQSGNTIDELTGAIGQMQNRLASGDSSAIAAVSKLGLTLKAIGDASPAQQLAMIAAEIGKIPDPAERTRLAMDLFGKQGTAILPTLTAQFAALAKAAPVMETSTVQALDKAGDQLAQFGLQIKVWAAESYNFIGRGFDALIVAAYKAGAVLADVADNIVKMAAKIPGASRAFDALGFDLRKTGTNAQWFRDAAAAMERKTEDVTVAVKKLGPSAIETGEATLKHANAMKAAAAAAEAHAKKLEDVNQKILEFTRGLSPLTSAQEALILKYAAMNLSTADIALKTGIAEGSIAKFRLEVDRNRKAVEDLLPKLQPVVTKIEELGQKMPIPSVQAMWKEIGVLNTYISGTTIAGDSVRTIVPLFGTILPGAIGQTVVKTHEAKQATSDWSQVLGNLSNDFTQLAQIGGDSFKGIAKAIGIGVASFKMASDGLTAMNDAMQAIEDGTGDMVANIGQVTAGYLGMAVAIYQVMDAIAKFWEANGNQARKDNFAKALARDFGTAQILSEELRGELVKLMDAYGKIKTEDLAKFGVDISGISNGEISSEALDKYNQQVAALSRIVVEALQLSAIIKELGGVSQLTGEQLATVASRLDTLFVVISLGGQMGREAVKSLDTALMLFAQDAIESGGLVNGMFVTMVKQAKAAGVELKGVNKFILDQLGSAAEGLNAIFVGLQASATASAQAQARILGKMTEEEIKNIKGVFTVTQTQGEGLAAAVAADFADMVQRGMSFKEALDKLAPSIEILRQALIKSGVDGGAAFDFLSQLALAAADPITGPLLDAIAGVNNALKGLYNAGILNQSMFAGLATTATDAYKKLLAQGVDANVALLTMAPTLQTLWQLEKDFGYKVDDATQAILDQAEAQGIVGDKHRDVASQMLLATQGIELAVRSLARAFGVDLPENAEEAANRIKGAMQDAGKYVNDLAQAVGSAGNGGNGGGGGGGGAEGASTGGIVTATGIQHFGRGGMVLPFRPRGSDTVPAMLTPGEMVLTKAQQRSVLGGGGSAAALTAALGRLEASQRRRDVFLQEIIEKAVKAAVQRRVA